MSPTDPATFLGLSAVLLAVVIEPAVTDSTCLIALASEVDPMVSLRAE